MTSHDVIAMLLSPAAREPNAERGVIRRFAKAKKLSPASHGHSNGGDVRAKVATATDNFAMCDELAAACPSGAPSAARCATQSALWHDQEKLDLGRASYERSAWRNCERGLEPSSCWHQERPNRLGARCAMAAVGDPPPGAARFGAGPGVEGPGARSRQRRRARTAGLSDPA